ncbi:MAG: sugar transporter, partial [Dialister sp.]|nr:sugar transporter [Dialister sp.]MDD6904901.1 sugar transporter [Dialister sp.]MDY3744757.1 sugar transporter [Dialister sp.]MDY5293435.1 sugar transporter [Dialister sp.]
LWGMAATAFNVGLQAETIQVTTSAEAPVAMSIFSGIFNLGIGSGTWLGGLLCTYVSITCIGFAGAAFAFLAFLYCVLKLIPDMKKEG